MKKVALLAFALLAVALSPTIAAANYPYYSLYEHYNGHITNSIYANGVYHYAPAGYKFVIFDIQITNQNGQNIYVGDPNYFTLIAGGRYYGYSRETYLLPNPMDGFYTYPGQSVSGSIVFVIQQNEMPTLLRYFDGNCQIDCRLSWY